MSNVYDTMLIVDVESTCWNGNPPPGEKSEIIEIGVSELDMKALKVIRSEGIIIKPAQSKVSEFCTQLTTITQAQVDQGISFAEACKKLEQTYRSKHDKVWGSYGDYDRKMFERNCKDFGVQYPFGSTHFNIKSLLAMMSGLKKELGMSQALDYLNIKLEGTHHRGVDDSINIAKILVNILSRK
jgi:inhibitor of KinA sporulation pathway (predicted exonuclease)